MPSTRPSTANTMPSSSRSWSATRTASRSWWVLSASRRARPSQDAAEVHPRLQCAERRTTSMRQRSSHRPVRRGPSPSPPTWPAVVPILCWAATPSIWQRPDAQRALLREAAEPRKARGGSACSRGAAAHRADGHGETTDANILAVRKRFDELYAQYKPLTEAEAEEVRAAGGLFIIGTERHESRRIDNQLRGRAGRQATPVHPASI